ALWPEDRRFSTRHVVHLPIAYEYQGIADEKTTQHPIDFSQQAATRGLGVTVDLNEMGVGFVAYERLPTRAMLRLRLWGRGESVDVLGEVGWMKALAGETSNGVAKPQGYRYGIGFRGVRAEQMDALNRICLHYAVPRLYAEYAEGRERTLARRIGAWVGKGVVQRRAAARRLARFPLVIEPNGRAEAVRQSVTEDVSRAGMS